MATISLQIPDDLLPKLGNCELDVDRELRLAAAFFFVQSRRAIHQPDGAAGRTSLRGFLGSGRALVQLFPIDLEEFKEVIAHGYTLGCQRIAGDLAGQSGAA